MASRYWVGGTATWDATAGTKWATTSGGAGGSAVPTSVDDVFFDASSGAVTITQSGARVAKTFINTGFTGTFAGSGGLTVSGNITFGAGATYTNTSAITINATADITSNGVTWTGALNTSTGTLTCLDALSFTGTFTMSGGTFNGGGFSITIGSMLGNVGTMLLGGGLWSITASNGNALLTGITSITHGGSTFKFTNVSDGSHTISTGTGGLIGDVWFTAKSLINLSGGGGGSVGNLRIDTPGSFVSVNSDISINSFTISGVASGFGTMLQMANNNPTGTPPTITVPGATSLDWVALRRITWAGGTVTATNSIDICENSGITITPPLTGIAPITSAHGMFAG